MKMYDFTLAPSPRRVRIFLTEKGIDVELVQVDHLRLRRFEASQTPRGTRTLMRQREWLIQRPCSRGAASVPRLALDRLRW
jgi:hypothetical protein